MINFYASILLPFNEQVKDDHHYSAATTDEALLDLSGHQQKAVPLVATYCISNMVSFCSFVACIIFCVLSNLLLDSLIKNLASLLRFQCHLQTPQFLACLLVMSEMLPQWSSGRREPSHEKYCSSLGTQTRVQQLSIFFRGIWPLGTTRFVHRMS